ncbi:valacyclovir hydrolase isoform X2 [Simochromis diagramma]|uniref:valacyclovir hydrolase isoform X2 n=1 Tax=Simochromis diagramma TaxID=43689 RepID=UPI001A7E7879|nr:valacyclovir hydrolase isoform X2 [Simochromis diagramma]
MALFLLGRRGFQRVMTAIRPYCSSVASGKKPVNGVDLYYEQTGRGKHAVLLLPGALGSTKTDFGPQLKSLAKERFTVVGWDPRGYGQSRPPDRDFPPDFFERDAKDAVDLMKTLGFGKFSLLGWSDGGITALVAAARNPDLINKMVVWGANAFVSQQDLKLYNGSICMELLPLISCPTLIIHGEKDPMVPILHPEYLLKHIKGSRLHLMPEGKHNLHLRHADEFNTLVEDFLEE